MIALPLPGVFLSCLNWARNEKNQTRSREKSCHPLKACCSACPVGAFQSRSGRPFCKPRQGLICRRTIMSSLQDGALRDVKGVPVDKVFQRLGLINFDGPSAHPVISESKLRLEHVTHQHPSSKAFLNGSLAHVLQAPPCPNHFGFPTRMPLVKGHCRASEPTGRAWRGRSGSRGKDEDGDSATPTLK